ncbi:MAG TPA: hypothetical protein VGK58_02605 [Lacipirellulaceae bacterium]
MPGWHDFAAGTVRRAVDGVGMADGLLDSNMLTPLRGESMPPNS